MTLDNEIIYLQTLVFSVSMSLAKCFSVFRLLNAMLPFQNFLSKLCTDSINQDENRKEEGCLRCQTLTATVRLQGEGQRFKTVRLIWEDVTVWASTVCLFIL